MMTPEQRKDAIQQKIIEGWDRKFGPHEDGINWTSPNYWTVVFLASLMAATFIPTREFYLGFIPHAQLFSGTVFAFTWFLRAVILSYARAMESFEPNSTTKAKRANEQIKLFAGLLNSSAVAIVGVATVRELFSVDDPNYVVIVLALTLSMYIHAHARAILGYLKDEAIAPPAV